MTAADLRRWLREKPLVQHASGARILFGPQRAQDCKDLEPGLAEALVRCLAEGTDYVVLDLPAYPSPASLAALARCHRLALVVEHEPTCVETGRAMLELLASLGGGMNVVGAVVVNRAPMAMPMPLKDLHTRLGCPVLGVIPPAPDVCCMALKQGSPVVLSEPTHAVAMALNELAGRISSDRVMAMAF